MEQTEKLKEMLLNSYPAAKFKLGIQCIPSTNQNYPDWLNCHCLLDRDLAMMRLFEEGSKETIQAEKLAHLPGLLTAGYEERFIAARNDFCKCGLSG